jgi:uncharacterized membrane protein
MQTGSQAEDPKLSRSVVDSVLPIFFLILAAPCCLVMVVITPPFQVPDEVEHYFYARAITVGSIFPSDLRTGGVGGQITNADRELASSFSGIAFHPAIKLSREMFEKAQRISDTETLSEQNYWGAAIYPPIAYAAPAAAMLIGDLFGLNRLQAFYAGRGANVFVFIVSATLAIWLIPVGKIAIAFIFLLPMTLFQAASFSPDGFVFALTALACAIIARESLRPTKPDIWSIIAATILLAVVSVVKAPIVALALPLAVVASRLSRVIAVACACSVLIGLVLWTLGFTLSEGFEARQRTLDNVSTARQLHFLLSTPFSVLSIAVETIREMGAFYTYSAIGILGWLDTPLANWFYSLALATGLIVMLVNATAARTLSSGVRLALGASGILAAALVFGALYLSWTSVGSGVVSGVQGRYFIPIFLPMLLAFSGLFGRFHRTWTDIAGIASIFMFHATSFAHVMWVMVVRYYLT